jgi:hypothetical protein
MARAEATEFAAQDGACLHIVGMHELEDGGSSVSMQQHAPDLIRTSTDSRGVAAQEPRAPGPRSTASPPATRELPSESGRGTPPARTWVRVVWFARPGFLARTQHRKTALPAFYCSYSACSLRL